MGWYGLAQDRDQWRVHVNTVMTLLVPYNAGKFLSSRTAGSFSRKTQLYADDRNNLNFAFRLYRFWHGLSLCRYSSTRGQTFRTWMQRRRMWPLCSRAQDLSTKYISRCMRFRMWMECQGWKRTSGSVISHGKEIPVTIPTILTLSVQWNVGGGLRWLCATVPDTSYPTQVKWPK
jgi:hypothetical protein